MKKLFLFLITVALFSTFTSCKKEIDVTIAEVEINCTGTYLLQGGKTYSVCNQSLLDTYNDGDQVICSFIKIDQCTEQGNDYICYMFFHYDQLIQITTVN